jgi:transcriptional regulator NrdR family protein
LEELFVLDDIAYIRYVSIHLSFEKAEEFINFINKEKLKK